MHKVLQSSTGPFAQRKPGTCVTLWLCSSFTVANVGIPFLAHYQEGSATPPVCCLTSSHLLEAFGFLYNRVQL